MQKLVINSYDDFATHVGEVLGTSEWLEVSQERINQFADATLDHQWIHVDPERAKAGPFGQTIVHGYLTLSLLPYMWEQIVEVNNLKMMVNYGMDKMKFGQAVLSGQSVRLVTTLQSIANLRGICKVEIKFTIEIKDQKKPALTGVATFLYHSIKKDQTKATCLPAILQQVALPFCRVQDSERNTRLVAATVSPPYTSITPPPQRQKTTL